MKDFSGYIHEFLINFC